MSEEPHPTDTDRHDHDRGLAFDVSTIVDRRRALAVLGGASLATLVGCATGSSSSKGADSSASSSTAADSSTASSTGSASSSTTAAASTTTTAATTAAPTTAAAGNTTQPVPEETAGPFPGDGSNGPNVLSESGIVRRDVTTSFGGASGVAKGVPTDVELTVLSTADGSKPLQGAAIYIWHCDQDGHYSLYEQPITDQNYLRGVQETGADGTATFATIFPGAYAGRWPHIHFEVYRSLADATSGGRKLRTSQIALPEATCQAAYATTGYEQSVGNLAGTSLDRDMVFSDGYSLQLGTATGDPTSGYTISLTAPV